MTALPRRARPPVGTGRKARPGEASALLRLLPLVVLLALALPAPVSACSCLPVDLEDLYDGADAVLRGHILAVETVDPQTWRVEVEVLRVWKGVCPDESSRRTYTFHTSDGASCGLGNDVQVGDTWIFFAHEQQGELRSNLCGSFLEWRDLVAYPAGGARAYVEQRRATEGLPELLAGSDAVCRGRITQSSVQGTWARYTVLVDESFVGSGGTVLLWVENVADRYLLQTLNEYLFFLEYDDGFLLRPCGLFPVGENEDLLAWLRSVTPVEPITWGRLKARYGDE